MKSIEGIFYDRIVETINVKRNLLESGEFSNSIKNVALATLEVLKVGGRVYALGNGGSAADSQHFVAELVSRLKFDRPGLPAEALTTDTSVLTALANDYGYEEIFARQVKCKVSRNDIVYAFSTSGRSKNVVNALRVTREMGIRSVLLTGEDGRECGELASYCLKVPSSDTATIQEVHIAIYHSLCDFVEQSLFHR